MEETRKAPSSKNEDRISSLPDEIIHSIMSLSDTKYAVQTSVLSKNWIGIWKSLPFLDFNRSSFSETQRFIDFVYMVMFRSNCDIEKFRLYWENTADTTTSHVNTWIPVAVKRNVQEVDISIGHYQHGAYEIPDELLNSKSLRKLIIEVHDFHVQYADILLPKSMSLPQLKFLSLVGCSISNVESFKRFLSSCPLIETLRLEDCDIQTDSRWKLIVDSPSLKQFYYTHFLNNTDTATKYTFIVLSAPKLQVFDCRIFLSRNYYLINSSPLSEVSFDMVLRENEEDENAEIYSNLPSKEKKAYARRMMRFLWSVHKVKKLYLSPGFLEVLSQAPDLRVCNPPCLRNLRHLRLEMWSTRGCLRAIAYLLKMSPKITSISLESKKANLADVGDDWEVGLTRKSLPGRLSRLKYVQIKDVEGCDAELKLLSYLLENAKVLQDVVLHFRSSFGLADRERQVKQFKDMLIAVPTASSSIRMAFKP